MGKRKKEKGNTLSSNVNVVLPKDMSKEEMMEVISFAMLKTDAKKVEQEQVAAEAERKKFYENIGIKEFSRKNGKPAKFRNAINMVFSLIRMLFLPAEKVEGERFTVFLLSFTVKVFCFLISFFLWMLTVFLIAMPIMRYLNVEAVKEWNWILSLYALPSVLVAQLFRLAGIEAEKMRDKVFLATVLAAILAFVTIVITIILR